MRARWPGLVAAARSSSPTSKRRAFYEFAPVPGGHFLVGVGHEPGGSDEPSFFREQILGQLEAGHELGESVCNVSRTWGSQDQQSGICYALFDPDQPTLQMSGSGTEISAIQVTVNSTRLVRFGAETAQGLPSHFVLRPGEALLLVAHPRAWGKHVLSVVDRSVTKDLDDLDQHIVLGFCGRIETLLQADGSASLVIYRMPRDTDVVDLHDGPAETGGYMRTFGDLDTSLTSSYLEFFEETGQRNSTFLCAGAAEDSVGRTALIGEQWPISGGRGVRPGWTPTPCSAVEPVDQGGG